MDFVLSSNSAPKAPARRGKKKTGSRFAWLKVFGRRPARTVLTAAFSAVLVGIAVNALFFQTSRHPAPLFGAPATPDVKRLAAPAPMPAPRPVEALQQATAPAAAQPMNIAPAAKQAVHHEGVDAAPTKAKGDEIAALLNGKGAMVAPVDNEKARVQAAQRALNKLGYTLKAYGVMGISMKLALEKFERDRNLPATGNLSARTVKELASQSRISIP